MSLVYTHGRRNIVDGTIDPIADPISLRFVKPTYTPVNTDQLWSSISSHEIVGTNYTAGGVIITGKAWITDTGADRVRFDFDNIAPYGTLTVDASNTIKYAILVDDTTGILLAATTFATAEQPTAQVTNFIVATDGFFYM